MESLVYNKLTELKCLKGTKEKSNWIKTNLSEGVDANIILDVLKVQFDPRIVTNLATKSMKQKVKVEPDRVILTLKDFLNYITTECTGKDVDISNVKAYLDFVREQYGEDVSEFCKNIAIKNVKLGVTEKTINDALGYTAIYAHGVWKGQALKDMDKLKGREVIVTPKLDGYRMTIRGGKEVISTNGLSQPIENFPEIKECLDTLRGLGQVYKDMIDNYMIDGEAIYNKEVGEIDRITRYNKTSSIMGKDGEKKDITLMAFDLVPIEEFDKGISTKDTLKRKETLRHLLQGSTGAITFVEYLYVGNDLEHIRELFADAIRQGDEGLILQTLDSKYETRKVSDGMWKLKVRDTIDVEVVGFEEGKDTGKNKGTLGNMLIMYKGSVCGVGSGFKELPSPTYPVTHTRDWIWANRDSLVGKIVEIEYDENKDKDGNFNIRHGVFLRWRDDKDEPSLN